MGCGPTREGSHGLVKAQGEGMVCDVVCDVVAVPVLDRSATCSLPVGQHQEEVPGRHLRPAKPAPPSAVCQHVLNL